MIVPIPYVCFMARPKEFDVDAAVSAAVLVFRDKGYEGTSAQMLVDAMGIGRQSLYDTFGDKWGIYCAALRHYCQEETQAHISQLASGARAIDGIQAMLARVVEQAATSCLGIGSLVEFGSSEPDLVKIRSAFGKVLSKAVTATLVRARVEGDVSMAVDLDHSATFLLQAISSIRLTAKSGATSDHVAAVSQLTMRALA
jgi:AcrR family transcriptional regulator